MPENKPAGTTRLCYIKLRKDRGVDVTGAEGLESAQDRCHGFENKRCIDHKKSTGGLEQVVPPALAAHSARDNQEEFITNIIDEGNAGQN